MRHTRFCRGVGRLGKKAKYKFTSTRAEWNASHGTLHLVVSFIVRTWVRSRFGVSDRRVVNLSRLECVKIPGMPKLLILGPLDTYLGTYVVGR